MPTSPPSRHGAWTTAAVVTAIAATATGGYLLLWAARWPHSDMRNTWAIAVGLVVTLTGLLAAAASRRKTWVFAAAWIAAGLALVIGLGAIDSVTHRQHRMCGQFLDACRSLPPGWR